MSAQPVYEDNSRDPEVILHGLPTRERPEFLRQYRAAAEAAREDVTQYKALLRLTEAVVGAAGEVVRLNAELAAHPGQPEVRRDRKFAKGLLRVLCARSVYAEHSDWVYARQYRLFMERERAALAEAAAVLAEAAP